MKKKDNKKILLNKPQKSISNPIINSLPNKFISLNEIEDSWSSNNKLNNFAKNDTGIVIDRETIDKIEVPESEKERLERNIKIMQELEKKEEERDEKLIFQLKQEYHHSAISSNQYKILTESTNLLNKEFLPSTLVKPSTDEALFIQIRDVFQLMELLTDCISPDDPFKLVYINKLIAIGNWNFIIQDRVSLPYEKQCMPLMKKVQSIEEYSITATHFNSSLDSEIIEHNPLNFEPPLMGNTDFIPDSHNN